MQKEHLILQVEALPCHNACAVELAKLDMSDASVEALNSRLVKKAKLVGWLAQGLQALVLLVIIANTYELEFGISTIPKGPASATLMFIPTLLTCALWMFCFPLISKVIDYVWAEKITRKLLRKLSESDSCEDALELLTTGSPEVTAWRDIALSEQRQLRNYDLELMDALYRRYLKEQKRLRRSDVVQRIHAVSAA